tara:strand:+ start:134 stop:619 length:486 start_codon:yes stop_codon:yes gene_type:complete
MAQVGVQKRGVFNNFHQTVVGGDDVHHNTNVVRTSKRHMFPEADLNPRDNFERDYLAEDNHRYINSRVKAFVRQENPVVLAKKEKLIPIGLLQESLSKWPNIAVVPNNFVRQIQYEQQIAREELDNPEIVIVGGKRFLVQKRKTAEQIANDRKTAEQIANN